LGVPTEDCYLRILGRIFGSKFSGSELFFTGKLRVPFPSFHAANNFAMPFRAAVVDEPTVQPKQSRLLSPNFPGGQVLSGDVLSDAVKRVRQHFKGAILIPGLDFLGIPTSDRSTNMCCLSLSTSSLSLDASLSLCFPSQCAATFTETESQLALQKPVATGTCLKMIRRHIEDKTCGAVISSE
jgi:hypothetical protein